MEKRIENIIICSINASIFILIPKQYLYQYIFYLNESRILLWPFRALEFYVSLSLWRLRLCFKVNL